MWLRVHETKEKYNKDKRKWESIVDEDVLLINIDKITYIRKNNLTSKAVIGLKESEVTVNETLEELEKQL